MGWGHRQKELLTALLGFLYLLKGEKICFPLLMLNFKTMLIPHSLLGLILTVNLHHLRGFQEICETLFGCFSRDKKDLNWHGIINGLVHWCIQNINIGSSGTVEGKACWKKEVCGDFPPKGGLAAASSRLPVCSKVNSSAFPCLSTVFCFTADLKTTQPDDLTMDWSLSH